MADGVGVTTQQCADHRTGEDVGREDDGWAVPAFSALFNAAPR